MNSPTICAPTRSKILIGDYKGHNFEILCALLRIMNLKISNLVSLVKYTNKLIYGSLTEQQIIRPFFTQLFSRSAIKFFVNILCFVFGSAYYPIFMIRG
jgi:hypothetical protein